MNMISRIERILREEGGCYPAEVTLTCILDTWPGEFNYVSQYVSIITMADFLKHLNASCTAAKLSILGTHEVSQMLPPILSAGNFKAPETNVPEKLTFLNVKWCT